MAMFLMTSGSGMFAVLTNFLTSRIVATQDEQEKIAVLIRQEMAGIRAELTKIREMLRRHTV